MIVMALDHVRDFFHADSFVFRPLDLSHTSVPLFFTRWITHFCAPGFVFLAGTSAYLVGQRKSTRELSLFLLTRGLWLVFLDLLVVNFGWSFNISFPFFTFNVLWALGASMMTLAAFVYFPSALFWSLVWSWSQATTFSTVSMLAGTRWRHLAGPCSTNRMRFNVGTRSLSVGYPLVPWPGVMALGYCCGRLYSNDFDAGHRRRLLILLGGSMILAFVMLRCFNLYGDASHWSKQSSAVLSFLSFIRTSKYPPSLLFLLMTLGPALLFLAFTENQWKGRTYSLCLRPRAFVLLPGAHWRHSSPCVAGGRVHCGS